MAENRFQKYVTPTPENRFAKYLQQVETPDAPPPQDPTEQMFVSREAVTDPRPMSEKAAGVAEGIAKGSLIGADAATFGLGNRAIAYGRGPMDYDKNVMQQHEYLKRIREENPERAMAAELAAGLGGGMGMARAGLTLVRPGMGAISRVLAGGTEGAIQGAAGGAGQSYGTLGEKAAAAGPGAILGGVVGGGVPIAVSGAGGVKTLFDITKGNIPQFPPSLLRAVDADRARGAVHVGVEGLPSLGPDAMLVDAGPSMLRAGQAAKTTAGPGSTALIDALAAREKQTIPRLRESLRKQFGEDVIPTHVENEIDEQAKALSPHWEAAFKNAKAVDTQDIANWLESQAVLKRGPAGDAFETVRKALNIKGAKDVLDPDPRTLHETRQMIDGFMFDQTINDKAKAAFGAARARISQELHDKVPGMANLDAKTAEVRSRLDAFKRGQELFKTESGSFVRPQEWIEEKAAMAVPKGGPRSTVADPSLAPKYSELGTREDIGRRVLTGTDDLRVLERLFGPHTAATENLMTQFGVKNVEDFQHAMMTNRTFRESYNKIVHGSKTGDVAENVADTERGYFAMPKFTVGGAVELVGDKLAQVQQGYGAGIRNRIAELLATRGPSLEGLRRELLDAAAEQARNDLSRTMLESAVRGGTATSIPRITVRASDRP